VKDFEVTIKLRNNQLKARRNELGLGIKELCKVAHISPDAYMGLESLKLSPIYDHEHVSGKTRSPVKTGWQKGDWRPTALKLAEFFGCPPEELFPDAIMRVRKSQIVAEFNIEQLPAAAIDQIPQLLPSPEDAVAASEARAAIKSAIETLPPREQIVLTQRFGFDGRGERTLDEVCHSLGVTRERARQIEAKALKKLRYPRGQIRALDEFKGVEVPWCPSDEEVKS
jgi:hypothetical protein